MLVRFLSYAASVVGSARQRAILASYMILLFACIGIVGVSLMHDEPLNNAASNTKLSGNTDNNQQDQVWLSDQELEKRDKQKTNKSAASNPKDNEETAGTDTVSADSDQPDSETGLVLSETEVTLTAGSISSDVFARISGEVESELTWSVLLSETTTTNNLSIVTPVDTEELPEGSTSFRVKASTSVKPGTYLVTVSAKNTELNLSKTLTVTVQ